MKLDEVWIRYKKTKDEELKKELIVEYLPLVKIISGRMYNFYGGNIEYDDLLGYGVFGLIDAIDKFELKRDLKFETYAQIRIRGAMIDNLRKLDWIPRRIRKKAKDMEVTISRLENKYGRSVTNEEIAKELGLDLREVENTLSEISVSSVVSLEDTISQREDMSFSSEEKTPEQVLEATEVKKILAQNIDKLREKEKLVISMYYFDELTYKEIGRVLELSESRISQIHSKAILSLKNSLNKAGVDKY
ncbi:RNA polymerase sigma-D factor [Andreesenia angusta]|uniref:RNA polymerase sigma-D factor n=1 Tax=Andreesenia angusta TaxID=39480 RepID=A0A1S1V855_9FIRM|nr:FliA/WhiG family RNA polymerase sigma factor [Andreesenia angusta]OHW62783.1 RNA polymerase sigma-D factor [Andreesenia angusta]